MQIIIMKIQQQNQYGYGVKSKSVSLLVQFSSNLALPNPLTGMFLF